MEIREAIEFVNQRLWLEKRRYLNEAETVVFTGAWNKLSYADMATDSGYSLDTLRGTVGYNFWHLLEEIFGVSFSKKSLQFQILRLHSNSISEISPIASKPPQIMGQLPDTSVFYGREDEIKSLMDSLSSRQLILISGNAGVGKSALVSQLATRTGAGVSHILWKSIYHAPPLSSLIEDILKSFNQTIPDTVEDKISKVIDLLKSHHCLVVLDGAESLLHQQRVGSLDPYTQGYSDYGKFWRLLSEESFASCVVLTSQQQFSDLVRLANSRKSIQLVKLEGLPAEEAKNILDDHGLKGSQWRKLVSTYRGNPFILALVANTIRDLFQGDVDEFLSHNTVLMNNVIKETLDQQFGSLNLLDQKVLFFISSSPTEEVDFSTVLSALKPTNHSVSELVQTIELLAERSLIEMRGTSGFSLQPIIAKYCKARFANSKFLDA